jgi:DNA-binding transcriptional MerR regulator
MEIQNSAFQILGLSSETLLKTEDLIRHDLENGRLGFIELIRNSKYQFSTGLSYRMLNYYTNEGMLMAKRNSLQGKRRLSFFDLHALKYLIACRPKTSKLVSNDFGQIIRVVLGMDTNNKDKVTQFELKLMSAIVMMGIQDVRLKTSDFEGNNRFLKLKYNLCEEIAESLRSLDYNSNCNCEFVTALIFEVDRLRAKLNLKVLSRDNLIDIEKSPFIAQFHKSRALEALPDLLKKPIFNSLDKYSSLYRSGNGMVYGMEIIPIGHEDFLAPEDRLKFNSSIDELIENMNVQWGNNKQKI